MYWDLLCSGSRRVGARIRIKAAHEAYVEALFAEVGVLSKLPNVALPPIADIRANVCFRPIADIPLISDANVPRLA